MCNPVSITHHLYTAGTAVRNNLSSVLPKDSLAREMEVPGIDPQNLWLVPVLPLEPQQGQQRGSWNKQVMSTMEQLYSSSVAAL